MSFFGEVSLNSLSKLMQLYPKHSFSIPDEWTTYKPITVSINGTTFKVDLHEALKGRLVPIVDSTVDYDELIDKVNKAWSNAQLRPVDVQKFRQTLASLQDDICPLCERELDAPVLDHWHTRINKGNGKVRLVICRTCNSLLGKIENAFPRYKIPYSLAPKWLENTAKYLLRDTTNLIHPTEKPKLKVSKTQFKKLQAVCEADGIKFKFKYPTNGMLSGGALELYNKYKERINE